MLAGVIVAASFGLVPVEVAATGGAVLMVLTGVICPRSAARALEPKVLGILAGSIGLGAIVVGSGLAEVLAEAICDLSGGPLALVIVLARDHDGDDQPGHQRGDRVDRDPGGDHRRGRDGDGPAVVLALIGTCVSFTLLNPFSHQSNMMVMQPGGYTGALFARFGVPLLAASWSPSAASRTCSFDSSVLRYV